MSSIQYVSITTKNIDNVDCYSFKDCRTFDTYPINIIDLSDPTVWTNSYSNNLDTIDSVKSLIKLNKFIKETKSKVVVILPQNEYLSLSGSIRHQISRFINSFNELLNANFDFVGQNNIQIEYSPSLVKMSSYNVSADFVFKDDSKGRVFFLTNGSSKKCALLVNENITITTMQLDSFIDFYQFVQEIPNFSSECVPDWADDYPILNDCELLKRKNELIKEVENANNEIDQIDEKMSFNKEIKSCLWKTGDDLVSAIFPLLETIYECDLSTFVDEKKPDFIFSKDSLTVVGEIKGVKSNVNRTHVAKAEAHKQEYIQELEDSNTSFNKEDILCVLIINYELDRPVTERDEINPEVIEYAKHQRVLILDTVTLIKLYERKLAGVNSADLISEMKLKLHDGLYNL